MVLLERSFDLKCSSKALISSSIPLTLIPLPKRPQKLAGAQDHNPSLSQPSQMLIVRAPSCQASEHHRRPLRS